MNVKNKYRFKKWISLGLLIFVVALAANNSFFIHAHSFNGKSVIHAHPYQKSDTGNSRSSHQHSSFELFLLDTFQSFFLYGFLTGLLVFREKGFEVFVSPVRSTRKREIERRYGRAPPLPVQISFYIQFLIIQFLNYP